MIAFIPLLLLLLATSAQEAHPTCDELGFTGEHICSDCDVLAQYVKDEELVAECKACCTKDQVSAKYTKAELLVDQWRISSLQQIKDFIDKRSRSYAPQLKVLYSSNGAPRLRLTGPSGTETIRIDNWRASSIAEFLDERLDRDGSSKGTVA
ncbi:hypothetical protein Vretimale_9563 [Volvox reticuliferus]|uniref:Selenoprotein F n=1 Tax=Volvox reticuliferus TaxID=1737510 RepID=A0A8J4CWH3_9CHLO|nr:hypothetical protein Vretifemale_18784 [Volvox reticuliferus]GIM05081.1 hypothetical protein Vretimale_9563 [Volvox reticuliferus]